MTPTVQIRLETDLRDYAAGDMIEGRVEPVMFGSDAEVKDTELSVLWYTEGKGDQDMGVVHLERLWEGMPQPMGEHRFSVRLPLVPLSGDDAEAKKATRKRDKSAKSKKKEKKTVSFTQETGDETSEASSSDFGFFQEHFSF